MTDDQKQRLFAGLRDEGIDHLREMAERDPGYFLEVVALLLDEAERAPQVQFIVRQQPGSDNRT